MPHDTPEPGWGERDAGSLRARLRPLARALREVRARARAARRLAGSPAPRGDVRIWFGFPELDARGIAIGGFVKVHTLAHAFPNPGRAFNVLYLVSSRLPDGAVALARAARRKGIAVVVNQNGVAYPGWYGRGFEAVNQPMADLLAAADHVFYQSEFCRLAADEFLRVRPRSSEVLYNSVDTAMFAPAPRPPAPFTLLLAGYQAKAYRVRTALETLARLGTRIGEPRLIITGRFGWRATDAEARGEAAAWARELGVAERVTFTGAYHQSEAPAIFQQASVLLHTKYNDPCPTVVLEAMSCGLPVVYSATGGVPELVGDDAGVGVAGELRWDRDVPPAPDALADAVLTVHARYDAFRAAARRRAVERYDHGPWLRRHAEVFQRLVA